MTMPPPTAGPVRKGLDRQELIADGWREGDDGLWRNDRFGGSYKLENALRRIGSQRGEETRPDPDQQEPVENDERWGICPHCGGELDEDGACPVVGGDCQFLPDQEPNPDQQERDRIIEILDEFYAGNGEDAEMAADAILKSREQEVKRLQTIIDLPVHDRIALLTTRADDAEQEVERLREARPVLDDLLTYLDRTRHGENCGICMRIEQSARKARAALEDK